MPMTTSTPSTPVMGSDGGVSVRKKGRTGLDGDASIVHVAADVGKNLGLEAKLADGLAIDAGLFGGGG